MIPGYSYKGVVIQVLDEGLFRPGREIVMFTDEVDQTTDWWAFAEGAVVPSGSIIEWPDGYSGCP